jgi:hypothetical protein
MDGYASKVFVKRMMDCTLSFHRETRTWYIGVISRTSMRTRTDHYLLEGHSLFARVWDFLRNGVPCTCVYPPFSLAVDVSLEYREVDESIILAYFQDSRDAGWPLTFGTSRDAMLYLRGRIEALELDVIQNLLSEDV